MYTDCDGKCDIYANAYRESVSHAHSYAQCYANSDSDCYADQHAWYYANKYSHAYGYDQANAYSQARGNAKAASHARASPDSGMKFIGRYRRARRSEARAVRRHDTVKILTVFCAFG
jgi:hypothetical protein